MDIILTILAIAIASWLVLGGVFLSYPTVIRLKEHKDELGWISLVPIILWLTLGYTADVVFNITWGTWIFREPPRVAFKRSFPWIFPELFTDRLRRHWHGNSEKMKRRAESWVWRVNLVHEGHV